MTALPLPFSTTAPSTTPLPPFLLLYKQGAIDGINAPHCYPIVHCVSLSLIMPLPLVAQLPLVAPEVLIKQVTEFGERGATGSAKASLSSSRKRGTTPTMKMHLVIVAQLDASNERHHLGAIIHTAAAVTITRARGNQLCQGIVINTAVTVVIVHARGDQQC